jgi:GlpG protein
MRTIGQLDNEALARTFSDYLYVQRIENEIEPEKDGKWTVWINSEDELERAKAELEAYRLNPGGTKFKTTARAAGDLKEKEQREQAAYEKRVKERRHLFKPLAGYGVGPVTFALIFICVGVYLLRQFGSPQAFFPLYISRMDLTNLGGLSFWQVIEVRLTHFQLELPEIQHGEIWRLFTPIFLHFSIMHIFFNMYCLYVWGSMIEGRQNGWVLVLLVLVIAPVSNAAQFFTGGPDFGGMSGVIFGLFGYIWIRGKLDPGSGLILHPSTVTMGIIWFFLCIFRVVPDVANTVHTVGLVMGMAWGWLSSLKYR